MDLMKELKDELAKRIKRDMEPFGKWNQKLWTKITFGDYYGKAPEELPVIHRVVGETVDNVLRRVPPAPGLQMTAASWKALRNSVDGADTAETALPDMENSALDNEKRSDETKSKKPVAKKKKTKKGAKKSAKKGA